MSAICKHEGSEAFKAEAIFIWFSVMFHVPAGIFPSRKLRRSSATARFEGSREDPSQPLVGPECPIIAAAAMSFSSASVIGNALGLRGARI